MVSRPTSCPIFEVQCNLGCRIDTGQSQTPNYLLCIDGAIDCLLAMLTGRQVQTAGVLTVLKRVYGNLPKISWISSDIARSSTPSGLPSAGAHCHAQTQQMGLWSFRFRAAQSRYSPSRVGAFVCICESRNARGGSLCEHVDMRLKRILSVSICYFGFVESGESNCPKTHVCYKILNNATSPWYPQRRTSMFGETWGNLCVLSPRA